MKKTYQKFLSALIAFMAVWTIQSCTGEFEELNTDPNNPVEIAPALLLPNAIQTVVDRYWGHSTRYERLNIDAAMCWVYIPIHLDHLFR